MKHKLQDTPPDRLPQAPLWVLSFADMITNLMAAFVMLQAFASATPTEAAFRAGQGSFKRAIKNFGLPSWLVNRADPPPVPGGDKKTNPMESQEEPNPSRVIDAEGDELRRVFESVAKATRMESSDPAEETLRRMVAPVTFAPGSADLSAADRQALTGPLAESLRQNLQRPGLRLLVAGLAPEGGETGASYVLSARRAAAAAEALGEALKTEVQTQGLQIVPWGVGEGAHWVKSFGGRPGKTYVLVGLVATR